MVRPKNPERERQQKFKIATAAMECFGSHGYEGATTALICKTALVSSGTLFHYFPTKVDLLVFLLELDTEATIKFFDENSALDPLDALDVFISVSIEQYFTTEMAATTNAILSQVFQPAVARALEANEFERVNQVKAVIEQGQERGAITSDQSSAQLGEFVLLILDGALSRAAVTPRPGFDVEVLRDTVRSVLVSCP